MICSTNLKLVEGDFNQTQLNTLLSRIENPSTKIDRNGELILTTGYIKNYKVTIKPPNVYFNGSAGKFVYGSNIFSLMKEDIKPMILEMKKLTGMPIQKAQIIGIDFAVNLFLSNSYRTYLPFFEESDGFLKGIDNFNGITYRKIKEKFESEFSIYNKLNDLRKNDYDTFLLIKNEMKKLNQKAVMRLEHRQKTGVRKALLPNGTKIMLVHLLSSNVNLRLLDLWFNHYSIVNFSRVSTFPTDVEGFLELKNLLASQQIRTVGLKNVLADIDEIAKTNNWDSKKKCMAKRETRNLYNSKKLSTTSHYINEIECEIENNSELNQWIKDWEFDSTKYFKKEK